MCRRVRCRRIRWGICFTCKWLLRYVDVRWFRVLGGEEGLMVAAGGWEREGRRGGTMGSTVQGFARGCEAENCDFKTYCGCSNYVWRSDGIHESAGLLVRAAPFLGM